MKKPYDTNKTRIINQSVDINQPPEPNSLEQESIILLSDAATDEQLSKSAAKARELVAGTAAEEQQIKVTVFPHYVYVKPDKTQYNLTININSDTGAKLL